MCNSILYWECFYEKQQQLNMVTFENSPQSSVVHLIRAIEHNHIFPQSFSHVFGGFCKIKSEKKTMHTTNTWTTCMTIKSDTKVQSNLPLVTLSPGQTDRQAVASGRDLRCVAKRTGKFPRKYTQGRHLTCHGWLGLDGKTVKKMLWLACKFERERKSSQVHTRPGQTESRVDPGFQLASTCDSV